MARPVTESNTTVCLFLRRDAMKRLALFATLCGLVAGSAEADLGLPLTNGDFSSSLSVGWTDYEVASIVGGEGVLGEDPWYFSFLEQEFTIPDLSLSLSFDYKPVFEMGGDEAFSASLLDPLAYDPLVATDADPWDPSESYFFLADSFGTTLTDSSFVTLTDLGGRWTNVFLDLTSLGGFATDALLAFDFIGFDDSFGSEISLDNASVSVVPVPGAVLLGLVGFGVLGLSRRFLGARRPDSAA